MPERGAFGYVRSNLPSVRVRLHGAARAAGRDPASIRLIAISKTFPVEAVLAAHAAGQLDFGENRVQEALQKIDADRRYRDAVASRRPPAVEQGAKGRDLLRLHPLHRQPRTAAPARRAAAEAGAAPDLLIQADLAGEETKFGAAEAAVGGHGAGARRAPLASWA